MATSHTTGPGGRLLASAVLATGLVAAAPGVVRADAADRAGEPQLPGPVVEVRPPPGAARGIIAVPGWVVWALGVGIGVGSVAVMLRSGQAGRS